MVCRVVHILHNPHNIGNAILVADGSSSIAYRIVCFASSILGTQNTDHRDYPIIGRPIIGDLRTTDNY